MPLQATGAIRIPSANGRRTVIAFVSATLISITVIVLLTIFDVK